MSIEGTRPKSAIRRKWRCIAAALAVAMTHAPAMAASAPRTRLVACPSGSCLLVEGHRDSPGAAVSINGHAVVVAGGRNWRARLPVAIVRTWSLPLARTITITSHDTVAMADLPIGLLGHPHDLAFLVIGGR